MREAKAEPDVALEVLGAPDLDEAGSARLEVGRAAVCRVQVGALDHDVKPSRARQHDAVAAGRVDEGAPFENSTTKRSKPGCDPALSALMNEMSAAGLLERVEAPQMKPTGRAATGEGAVAGEADGATMGACDCAGAALG